MTNEEPQEWEDYTPVRSFGRDYLMLAFFHKENVYRFRVRIPTMRRRGWSEADWERRGLFDSGWLGDYEKGHEAWIAGEAALDRLWLEHGGYEHWSVKDHRVARALKRSTRVPGIADNPKWRIVKLNRS